MREQPACLPQPCAVESSGHTAAIVEVNSETDFVARNGQFQAFARGVSVDLTRREFELIQLLAEAEGHVLQREEIYERVWGYAMVHGDRSVDVFVRKLRSKLEKASSNWRYIHTHFGIGYRFSAEPVEPAVGAATPVPEPIEVPDLEPVALPEPDLVRAG